MATINVKGLGRRAKVFPPVGKCIYCGTTATRLDEEHIIPLGLGGNMILPAASCAECSKITGTKIEAFLLDAMWGTFGAARLRMNLPTRRPKKRPKSWTYPIVDKNGVRRSVSIPASDVPIALIGLTTNAPIPGVLLGKDPNDRFVGTQWVKFNNDEMQRFANEGDSVSLGKLDPFLFGRMVAKIAHSLAMADPEYRDKFKPRLPDIILGKSPHIFHYISATLAPDADHDGLHNLHIGWSPKPPFYLIAYVRLFCNFGTPDYMVAVGERYM